MSRRHPQSSLVERDRRARRRLSWVAVLVVVLVGVGGFAASMAAQRSLDGLAAHGVPATGLLLTVGVTGSDRPVVTTQFALPDGATVVARSNRFDSRALDLRHGDLVELLYDPAEPTVVQGADWSPPGYLPWLGSAWLLLTLAVAAGILTRTLTARRPGGVDDADDEVWLDEGRPRVIARP